MKQTTTLLFVYGSLKKGCYNHRLLKGSEYINKMALPGTLYDLGTYPAMTIVPMHRVVGEIYRVSLTTYQRIQDMEFSAGYVDRALPIYRDWLHFFTMDADASILQGAKEVRTNEENIQTWEESVR